MRSSIQAIAAGCAVLFCVGTAPPERIEYTLTPVLENGALTAVQYDLRFRGDADGESSLRLPDDWGGQGELWKGIDALQIVSGATLREGDRPNQRLLSHRPNGRIHVRYRVIQDWEGAPRAELGNTYRPAIQPNYFHLIGDASLVTPGEAANETRVRLRVRNLPRGWTFASDLEHDGLTLQKVWSSVTVGGDFRVLRDPATGVRLAIRGQWSFTDQHFLDEASRIIGAQRTFWSDPASPFLITVIQLEGPENWISLGGTGLTDAFAFFATANSEADAITRTLSHETFHTWISPQVGGLPREEQALQYWLSEGFTDFYTPRLLVRAGIWTPQDYAADLNEALRAYAQSPVRTAPNARILADYWSDRAVQRLPYLRGRFLAMIWDGRLRPSGRNMDDVVLAMRQRARNGEEYAVEVLTTVARDLNLDLGNDLATYVDEGAVVLLPEDLLAPCGRITRREVPTFHRGFDIEATQANNNVIAGVDPELPAYAAGVRNGMTLIRRDTGEIGDSEQEIAYVMRDGDTERTFRYMPRGRGSFTLQELTLAEDLSGDRLAQCLNVMSGA
jgi:predicted metalloprotease with PDZ domain